MTQHGFGWLSLVFLLWLKYRISWEHENPLMFVSTVHKCLWQCQLRGWSPAPLHPLLSQKDAAVARGLFPVAVTNFGLILKLWNQLSPICNLYILCVCFYTLFWSLCVLSYWSKCCVSVCVCTFTYSVFSNSMLCSLNNKFMKNPF